MTLGHDGQGGQIAGLLGEVGGRADLGGDLLIIDQRTIQAAAFAGRQNAVQHGQGGAVGVGVFDRRPADHHGGQGDVGRIIGDVARSGRLGLGHIVGRQRRGRVLQRNEILIDPAVQLGLVEVAGDDQIGVVGPVVGGVEAQDVVQGRGVQLLDRTDAGTAIGAFLIQGLGHKQAEQTAIGVGQDALAIFFLHHVALGDEGRLVHDQGAHPLGLGEQHPLQVVGGDGLEIGGGVVCGEGVVRTAHIFGQPVEGFRRQVPGRLEHQMFEQVGEARAAGRIVLGPDLVPDLDRHVRGVGVAGGVDLQPVRQDALGEAQGRDDHALLGLGRDRRRRECGGRRCEGGRGEAQQQGRGGDGGGEAKFHAGLQARSAGR